MRTRTEVPSCRVTLLVGMIFGFAGGFVDWGAFEDPSCEGEGSCVEEEPGSAGSEVVEFIALGDEQTTLMPGHQVLVACNIKQVIQA